MKKKDAISYVIQAAPAHLDNIVKTRSFWAAGREFVFVATNDGCVFRLHPRRQIDISQAWESNETVRREVCRLTGWKLADLKAHMRKRRLSEAKRAKNDRIKSLRDQARRLGFRLVKQKAAP